MTVDLKDFVAGFLLEAEEHLHSANQNLVATAAALKKGQPEPRAVRELFRSLHTIKGLSSMVGAEPIVDISHEMEGLLRIADRSGGRLSESTLDLLLEGIRLIEERVREISLKGIQFISPAPAALIEALALAQQDRAPELAQKKAELNLPEEILKTLSASDREELSQGAANGRRIVLIEFQPSPERAGAGFNITSARENLAKLGELVKVLPKSSPGSPTGIAFGLLLVTSAQDSELAAAIGSDISSVATVEVALPAPVSPKAAPEVMDFDIDLSMDLSSPDQSTIRVDVKRLDDSLEQLSSLFVTRFKLDRVAADLTEKGVDTRELKSVIAENARQLRRLRNAISEARMVPLSDLLQRIPLVVRGITRGTDKSVNVVINAGSAEVDKSVADKIFPAVIHLVRNAVDHALESREERRAAGKNESGELVIHCDDTSGTTLILTVTDDGRGVDAAAVARKLNCTPASSEDELLQQICSAGLSTSEKLTHTSGRGMGMDIVKRSVEMLGGALTLATESGRGTTMTMRVPVTITIVDVLSFVCAGQFFVSPVAGVDEIVEVAPENAVDLPVPHKGGLRPRLIQYRGKTIPLYSLGALLRGEAESIFPRRAMVVKQASGQVAFGVDRMIGQQEAVVRPVDDSLVKAPGMAGATDLGDGRPTLVLDFGALANALSKNGGFSL